MNHDVRSQLLAFLPCQPGIRCLPLNASAAFSDGIATSLELPGPTGECGRSMTHSPCAMSLHQCHNAQAKNQWCDRFFRIPPIGKTAKHCFGLERPANAVSSINLPQAMTSRSSLQVSGFIFFEASAADLSTTSGSSQCLPPEAAGDGEEIEARSRQKNS